VINFNFWSQRSYHWNGWS